jgi:hypothetical protein
VSILLHLFQPPPPLPPLVKLLFPLTRTPTVACVDGASQEPKDWLNHGMVAKALNSSNRTTSQLFTFGTESGSWSSCIGTEFSEL